MNLSRAKLYLSPRVHSPEYPHHMTSLTSSSLEFRTTRLAPTRLAQDLLPDHSGMFPLTWNSTASDLTWTWRGSQFTTGEMSTSLRTLVRLSIESSPFVRSL